MSATLPDYSGRWTSCDQTSKIVPRQNTKTDLERHLFQKFGKSELAHGRRALFADANGTPALQGRTTPHAHDENLHVHFPGPGRHGARPCQERRARRPNQALTAAPDGE